MTSRQTEPQVTLFARTSRDLRGFGPMTTASGQPASLGTRWLLGWVYLNQKAADKLDASAGDSCASSPADCAAPMRVKAIVRFDGAGTDGAAVLMPLSAAQTLLGEPGRIKYVLVSNRGDAISGAATHGPGRQAAATGAGPAGLAGQQDEARHAQDWQTRPAQRSFRCSRRSGRSRSPLASC